MPPPDFSMSSGPLASSCLPLGWKSEDAFRSIYPQLADLATSNDWTAKGQTISSLVDALTIQSTEFAQYFSEHLTTQGKEYRSAFEDIAMAEDLPVEALAGQALVPFQSAMGGLIRRDLNQRDDRPGYLQLLDGRLDGDSKLTQFEGRFIPMLFTGEILESPAEWRRNTWKDLSDDNARIDFIHEILNALRSDEHTSGTAMNEVEFNQADRLKGSWGFSTTARFIIMITDEQRAAWVKF